MSMRPDTFIHHEFTIRLVKEIKYKYIHAINLTFITKSFFDAFTYSINIHMKIINVKLI